MTLTQQELLMKLGAARSQYPRGWQLVEVGVDKNEPHFTYRLNREKLKQARRREGHYLMRTNLTASDPAELWRYYLQLTQVEEAFKNLKGDLAIRPIHHQLESRIAAHMFIAFLAYCLHVTLAQQFRPLAAPYSEHRGNIGQSVNIKDRVSNRPPCERYRDTERKVSLKFDETTH